MRAPVTRSQPTREPAPLEQELVARARGGDPEAFRLLLRPHVDGLAALARRAVGDVHWADDLVQETLLRAVKGLDGWRGEASFRTWLFAILVRLASEPRRWRKGERAGPLDVEVPDAMGLLPPDAAISRELSERLAEALERLPPRQRAALHLRAAEGLDYERIAEVLSCRAGAARMLVLEARRRVMERLGRHLEP